MVCLTCRGIVCTCAGEPRESTFVARSTGSRQKTSRPPTIRTVQSLSVYMSCLRHPRAVMGINLAPRLGKPLCTLCTGALLHVGVSICQCAAISNDRQAGPNLPFVYMFVAYLLYIAMGIPLIPLMHRHASSDSLSWQP